MSTPHCWLEGARLAPSAHNTQPWRFLLLPDGRTQVGWDPARTLPAGDPTSRDLYLALGAAIESARLRSAEAHGVMHRFIPAPDHLERTVGWLDTAQTAADASDLRLAPLLSVRQTARAPHLPRQLHREVIAALQEEAERGGSRLRIVQDQADIRRLAALARVATAAQLADPNVHGELWRWLRLNPRDPAYHRDGLTADCLELRGETLMVARMLLQPDRMRRLVRIGIQHVVAVDTQRLVEQSASICLLSASSGARADLVGAGRVLLRLWLLAAGAGLHAHPISALLDCAQTVGSAAAVFGPRDGVPVALFRLGATRPVARAPRLPADELLQSAPPQ